VGLERGSLSLVSTTEELLERKSSGFCLENREYGRRNPSRSQRGTLCPQKLATTSPRSGGRSVGIVLSRTQTMEFVCLLTVSGGLNAPYSMECTVQSLSMSRIIVKSNIWEGTM
jgi:hypothetical protein